MADDERLLHLLARALEPAPVQPPASGVEAVRRRASAPPPQGRARRAWMRRSLVGLSAAAVAAVSFGAGVLVSDDLPRPVREVAHRLGLPVESPELVEAREELERLGVALGKVGTPAFDPTVVAAADARMVRLVKALDDEERRKVEPVAHEVHLRAVAVLKGPN